MWWDLAAALALLWPARISGPLDGLPLDGLIEVVVLGVALPLLWCLHRRFLARRSARTLIVALLIWKAFSSVLAQGGWCVRVTPERPFARDAVGAPHSWDIRADWRSADPVCSAIMTAPYRDLHEFPVWFFNLPPPDGNVPAREDRPPGARVAMTIRGFISARRAGQLWLDTSDDVMARLHVDGASVGATDVFIEPGLHSVQIDSVMSGDRWRLVPMFNNTDVWARRASTKTTVTRPSRLDLVVRSWGAAVPAALVVGLLLMWTASAIRETSDWTLLVWTAAVSIGLGLLMRNGADIWSRWAIAALACAAFLPVRHSQNDLRRALWCIGIPWLTFVIVRSAPQAGHFTLYSAGDDFWMFQRFAYRIVMQGYWLEGGSPTFWFQPLYRWIAGVLHLVFGDSSIGESIWDGAGVLIGALAAFTLTRACAGFRWGIVAASLSLTVFALSATHTWFGIGLSEISSAGFIYLAVIVIVERGRTAGAALAAGILAALGFYTRLNNLVMACGVALFACPLWVAAQDLLTPGRWLRRVAWWRGVVVLGTIAAAVLLFEWRTWHYTGVFSLFHGTQREMLATWQPGMGLSTVATRMLGSVMMILTINDPPRLDPFAVPVLAGAMVACLSLLGLPRLRTLPLAFVSFFFASIAGALVARGSAYSGRFSVHIIPITCALVTSASATLAVRVVKSQESDPAVWLEGSARGQSVHADPRS
ncbi:MAG TPA: hypothetical protein VKB36_02610 [Vicinamibacterales bacterium]|nr:hypothetical protein [Vicinamibacterales bacterium]